MFKKTVWGRWWFVPVWGLYELESPSAPSAALQLVSWTPPWCLLYCTSPWGPAQPEGDEEEKFPSVKPIMHCFLITLGDHVFGHHWEHVPQKWLLVNADRLSIHSDLNWWNYVGVCDWWKVGRLSHSPCCYTFTRLSFSYMWCCFDCPGICAGQSVQADTTILLWMTQYFVWTCSWRCWLR